MRFARVGETSQEVPAVMTDEGVFDVTSLTGDIDGAFLVDGPGRVRDALERGALPRIEMAGRRFGAPIARPSAIICIGMNYAAHAAESGAEPPEHLVIFMKTPNTVAGAFDPVAIPRGSAKTDWEVELGVVIGRRASYLTDPAEARTHIGGYVLANDLSERAWQLEISGGQWGKGKSAPGFSPIGPWVATADELDAGNLRLRSWVNGEPRQDSSTADLIVGVDEIVWQLSQFMVLEPGDLVLTGTPEGVALSGRFPYLVAGDVVELEIDGLGRQRQEMV